MLDYCRIELFTLPALPFIDFADCRHSDFRFSLAERRLLRLRHFSPIFAAIIFAITPAAIFRLSLPFSAIFSLSAATPAAS